jgi:hypothetical protein
MSVPQVFQRITTALDRAGIAYMLTGSFAAAYYGTARSTQDIDLVIETDVSRLKLFVESLSSSEYYADRKAALDALQHLSPFNAIDLSSGLKIDLIFRKSRLFSREEFKRRRSVDLQGVALFIATAEDIVISKLEWANLGQLQRQLEDVAAILKAREALLDRAYLEKWILDLGLKDEWSKAQAMAARTA